MVLKVISITIWISLLFLGVTWVLFRKILPKYKITVSEVTLSELLIALNAMINTELDLWKDDVFNDNKGVANNSQYENYYHEICGKILYSISPIFYDNIEKYITSEAVVSIIGRKVKNFLNTYVKEPFPDPTEKMLFDEQK